MKQKTKSANVGIVGEDTACRYLENKGFSIKCRNYRQKWGEIDIIGYKSGITHFIEVKTVSRNLSVARETLGNYRPEDNVHTWKIQRLSRTIQTYMFSKKIEGNWQFDVITVYLDLDNKMAKVEMMENLVL